jgi:hypothetical protein
MSLLADLLNDAKVYRGKAHGLMRQGYVGSAKSYLRSALYCVRQAKRLLKRTNK